MASRAKPLAQEVAAESPTAWFAVMESSMRRRDVERAAYAKRKLEELGVEVKFRKGSLPQTPE